MKELRIAWLFPDTLYLHGERGNILALQRISAMKGLEASVDKIDFDTEGFDPMDYDIIFCPPGEIVSFPVVLEYLKPYAPAFERFVSDGRPLIATGTSVGLWCREVQRADGSAFEAMGLLDAAAKENTAVYGDDVYFACQYGGTEMEVLGNQIQMADFLSESEEPFGRLIYGYGNTGKDRREGFARGNSIFTNTLGPMLVTNPWLTEAIVETAARTAGLEVSGEALDTSLEKKSFDAKKTFIAGKETRLTNCKA